MHFGIFLEERRRGSSEATAFDETLELAYAAEVLGTRRRVARRDPLQSGSLRTVGTDRARELHCGQHAARASGDGRSGPSSEQPTSYRRRGRNGGPPQRGSLRLRDRSQRLSACLRRAWRSLCREPGPLPRSPGDHSGSVLAEFVHAFSSQLRVAQKSSPCVAQAGAGDAEHHFYTRLVNISPSTASADAPQLRGCLCD